jgi:FG-GAP-like repeat/ASPIC and UnbV
MLKINVSRRFKGGLFGLIALGAIAVGHRAMPRGFSSTHSARPLENPAQAVYQPRIPIGTSGFELIIPNFAPASDGATLEEIAASWRTQTAQHFASLDRELAQYAGNEGATTSLNILKASLFHFEGDTVHAAELLDQARARAEKSKDIAEKLLYTIIYYQGVTAMRQGENDNCVMCRDESSCILPISRAAIHVKPAGSRSAVRYFTEYLDKFPDDFEVQWLLNIAHMTLGEHPEKVDPRFLISIDRFVNSEFDIGKFRDVAHLAGVNRLNQAGGAIMDDFDNDGRLDLIVTAVDPTENMAFYRNMGDGTFENRAESAGLSGQLGGLTCYQADYNNDGCMDVFICRGAWLSAPIRPTLLRNDGGTFTDVTKEAGLLDPFNSNAACWADYDNDGFVDLFIACERQPNRLYHNRRDGTFEDVALKAGLPGKSANFSKGATWIDYDNDGAPDLFLNNMSTSAQLFHNDGEGRFSEVTLPMKVGGARHGFSCWAWDFDNDGWLDIFATCYDRPLDVIVGGLLGRPHAENISRLFRNTGGKEFEDVTERVGLNQVYGAMGSNFGDLDNDGFLDFYLGTGDPGLATLIPNRMFKNVGGARFAEITGTSRTGHLQKGHGVAIGDWDNDGDADLFIEMGGAVNGDKYHNVLFQNPGQGNHWLTVKLVGERTNRAAIGARIKVVTNDEKAMTIHRHVTSGSSFGANPLQQTIGLAKADRVATLEIYWPTSKTTQVFRDVPVDQSIEIVEFSENYRRLESKPIPLPE